MPTGIPYHPNDDDRNMLKAGLFFGLPLKDIGRRIGVTIPTLKRHYGDVIRQAQLKRGPKPHEPTDLEKELVIRMAAVGVPHADIASRLDIGKGTVQRHFPVELSIGRTHANFAVAKKILEMATGDPTKPSTALAAIWWSKVHMGWTEAGPAKAADDPVEADRVQVVIYRPEDVPDGTAPDEPMSTAEDDFCAHEGGSEPTEDDSTA